MIIAPPSGHSSNHIHVKKCFYKLKSRIFRHFNWKFLFFLHLCIEKKTILSLDIILFQWKHRAYLFLKVQYLFLVFVWNQSNSITNRADENKDLFDLNNWSQDLQLIIKQLEYKILFEPFEKFYKIPQCDSV